MSEDNDNSQKTEEPTEKRRADARKKGDLPVSREVATTAGLGVTMLLAAFALPSASSNFVQSMAPIFSNVHQIRIDGSHDDVLALLSSMGAQMVLLLSPVFLSFALAAFGAAFMQNAVVFATDRIKPKPERIDLMKGIQRLFSTSALVELAKSMSKVVIAAAVVIWFITEEVVGLYQAVSYDINALPTKMSGVAIKLIGVMLVTTVLITVLDVLWRRIEWTRKLRMTKQQVKDEHKQMEGDPHIKQRLAEIRRNHARKARIDAVPKATVLVMNPTHYAVALKYDQASGPAPICVAKGRNLIALKMREVAEAHNVPVVENPPLARALHAAVQEDHPIPHSFYMAVAEVINFVYRSQKRSLTL